MAAFIHGLGKSTACIKFIERFIYGFSGAVDLFNLLDLNCNQTYSYYPLPSGYFQAKEKTQGG